MRLHYARQMGETRHMVERRGDFGGACVAMALHARDPARVRRAGADDAGDFFAQAAGAGIIGPGVVEVIERGFPARHTLRGGEPGLVPDVVHRKEEVGFRQVLRVHEGLRPLHPRGDPGVVAHRVFGAERIGRSGQPCLPRRAAAFFSVILHRRADAEPVGTGRRAIDAGPCCAACDERVPFGALVPRRQRLHRLLEKAGKGWKDVAEKA